MPAPVDIATGAILSSTCRGGAFGVAVIGEPRAGFAAAGVAPVPAASKMSVARSRRLGHRCTRIIRTSVQCVGAERVR